MQLEQKIEYWKNRLLDLGKRNRLIHCALPKESGSVSRTSLMLYHPLPQELWKVFAENDSFIEFPIPADNVNRANDEENQGSQTEQVFRNGY